MGGYSTCIYTDFDEHTKRLDAKHAIGSVKDQNFDASWDIMQLLSWANSLQGAQEWRDPYRYM
jgi:hypothetical protein